MFRELRNTYYSRQQMFQSRFDWRLLFVCLCILGFLVFPNRTVNAKSTFSYPRIANYFLDDYVYPEEAEQLSKWDVVILSPEAQDFKPEIFDILRSRNPDIVILAYISASGVVDRAARSEFPSLAPLGVESIPREWWLKGSEGTILNYWPNTRMLNVSSKASYVDGARWNEWLPGFIASTIYDTGYWDGIFVDEAFGEISWLNGGDIDLDGDGRSEKKSDIDQWWREGMDQMLGRLRERIGSSAYLVVNGSSAYAAHTNGRMHETIFADTGRWEQDMGIYLRDISSSSYTPSLTILNTNTGNTGRIDTQRALFGFASALLSDGFYSYDYGDQRHMDIWWLPEYDIELGSPRMVAYNMLAEDTRPFESGLWRRDFDQGIVLVNSTKSEHDYTITRDGILYSGSLEPYNGLVLSHIPSPAPVLQPDPVPVSAPNVSDVVTDVRPSRVMPSVRTLPTSTLPTPYSNALRQTSSSSRPRLLNIPTSVLAEIMKEVLFSESEVDRDPTPHKPIIGDFEGSTQPASFPLGDARFHGGDTLAGEQSSVHIFDSVIAVVRTFVQSLVAFFTLGFV